MSEFANVDLNRMIDQLTIPGHDRDELHSNYDARSAAEVAEASG